LEQEKRVVVAGIATRTIEVEKNDDDAGREKKQRNTRQRRLFVFSSPCSHFSLSPFVSLRFARAPLTLFRSFLLVLERSAPPLFSPVHRARNEQEELGRAKGNKRDKNIKGIRKKRKAKNNMQAPITVFTQGGKRESGKKAQFGNIMAAKVRARGAEDREKRGRASFFLLLVVVDRTRGDQRSDASRLSFSLNNKTQAVADIVRTTLGPRAMLKMLLDASGGAFESRKKGERGEREFFSF